MLSEHKDSCKAVRKQRLKEEEDQKLLATLSTSFENLQKEQSKVELDLATVLAGAIKEASAMKSVSVAATEDESILLNS